MTLPMAPQSAVSDPVDDVMGDAVFAGYGCHQPTRWSNSELGSDLVHDSLSQLPPPRAMSGLVEHVFPVGVPPQVLEPWVGRVAVGMARLHTFRTRADEGLKHESMHEDTPLPVRTPERAKRVAMGADGGGAKPPTASHSPVVADFVQALVAYDRKPAFHLMNVTR